jgi:AhpD family alkylhydroperoxidase
VTRIPLVDYETATPAVRALLEQMGSDPRNQLNVARLFANHEGFLAGFVAMVRALYAGASLSPRLRELAYLRASQLNACHYWVPTHLALGSSVGISDEELSWLGAWQEAPVFDAIDRLVLRYADSITQDVRCGDDLWAELAGRFSEREIFELAMSAGLAALVNRVHATFLTDVDERTASRVDALAVPPEVRPAPRH